MYDFIFKPFAEMTEEDYRTVGFKSGLEIHQQLYTEKKLFCHCPAGIYSKQYDAEILRHMRPTLSEMGVYDGTALDGIQNEERNYLPHQQKYCLHL